MGDDGGYWRKVWDMAWDTACQEYPKTHIGVSEDSLGWGLMDSLSGDLKDHSDGNFGEIFH